MKKIKKIIIILICVIIILLIAVCIVLKNNSNGNITLFNKKIEEQELADEPANVLQISDYFLAKNCIQNYLDIANSQNSIYYDKQDDGNQKYNEKTHKEILYKLLNESYIKDNNITVDNIFDYVKIFNTKHRFYPTSVTILSEQEIVKYKVSGIAQDLDYKNAQEVYYGVNYHIANKTFSVSPLNKNSFEIYKGEDNITKIDEKEGYNICDLGSINDELIATEYFEAYKFFTLANPKYTFDKMTEEYRNKRFGTYENYVQYIKDNYNEFKDIIPKRYLSTFNGQYTQYVIQDQYSNNYIFDSIDALQYYVSLDTYTIDGEKFSSTYAGADETKKVQMNIGKFFDMINRHDYRTAYSCLADSFKNNKVKSEQELKAIIQNNLFSYNKYEVKELKNIGSSTYTCNLYVEDSTKSNPDGLFITIIMRLKEDKNFEMSFSIS